MHTDGPFEDMRTGLTVVEARVCWPQEKPEIEVSSSEIELHVHAGHVELLMKKIVMRELEDTRRRHRKRANGDLSFRVFLPLSALTERRVEPDRRTRLRIIVGTRKVFLYAQ